MKRLKYILMSLMAIVALSCENDPYDTGEGSLSKTTTAFGDAEFDVQGRAFKFVTDDGQMLNFTSLYGKANPSLAGKQERSLLYYNITDEKNVVKPYALVKVLTADVLDKDKVKDMSDDPVNLEAAWVSANKKYLNLYIKIKTSSPKNESMRHTIGVVYDGSDNSSAQLRLIHDDSDIPGNYTASLYFSVRMQSVMSRNPDCSKILVRAMTYKGPKTIELDL